MYFAMSLRGMEQVAPSLYCLLWMNGLFWFAKIDRALFEKKNLLTVRFPL
jgi:hypothetical protein